MSSSIQERPDTADVVVRPSAIGDVEEFYARLRRRRRLTALLESLGPVGETSRYSFVGAVPAVSLVVRSGQAVRTDLTDGSSRPVARWTDVLDEFCRIGSVPGAHSPFQTGVIGYVGYDAKYDFEELDRRIPADTEVPDVFLVKYAVVLVVDRLTGQATWVAEAGHEHEIEELEALDREPPAPDGEFHVHGDVVADFTREEYLDWIERTIEYIRAGDIFQANITARFHAAYSGDLYTLYRQLRVDTPNPFFAFLDFPDPVLSTSPERFFAIRGRRIATHPIKGTAPISIDGTDQAAVLAASEKDRAENTMIVDLMRNDIGRVCEHATVVVDELCGVRKFNQLYHLESVISGTLREDVGIGDVIAAVFPGGSITGAPKIRSMDIIEELENRRRGPYCGTIGFFGAQGWVDTNIAIRTLYGHRGRVFMHSGGGITIGSRPEAEYAELMLKAERMRRSLERFNLLAALRKRIDDIDDQLFDLLHRRFATIRQVGEVKRRYGIPTLQSDRWASMIARQTARMGPGSELPPGFVERFYELVVNEAMALEEREHSDLPVGR